MKLNRRAVSCLLLALNVACASARPVSTETRAPRLLSWSEQLAVREAWLAKRHELLLPMMRRHGVGMWIVVNEEFHDDPLTPYVAPPRPYAGNRDVFVFIDAGEQGLKKYALPAYEEENLARFFEVPEQTRVYKQVLGELYAQYRPATIALGIGGRRGVTHSLTRDAYTYLVEALGPEAEVRFISAAPLIEEYLDTRIPEELEHYRTLVGLTEQVVRRARSPEVVRPGVTTVGGRAPLAVRRAGALGRGHLVPAGPARAAQGTGPRLVAGLPRGGEGGRGHPEGGLAARGLRHQLPGPEQ